MYIDWEYFKASLSLTDWMIEPIVLSAGIKSLFKGFRT